MSELRFESVLNYCHSVYAEEKNRRLYDGEIAALHCAWDRLTFRDYTVNQKIYVEERQHIYKHPFKEKKEKTLPASSSRVLKVIGKNLEPYLNGHKLSKSNFRHVMESLFIEGVISFPSSDPSSNKKNLPNVATLDEGVLTLYGRFGEMRILSEQIKQKDVISVWGYPGVGKTHLLRCFLSKRDGYKIFRDMRSIDDIQTLQKSICEELDLSLEGNIVDSLISYSENNELLILIDSVGDLSEEIQSFLYDLCLRDCDKKPTIFLGSRRNLRLNLPIDRSFSLHLKGFEQPFEFNELFQSLKLKDQSFWPKLNEIYEGNIRQLLYVSEFINNFFDGSVSKYFGLASIVISSDMKSIFKSMNFTDLDLDIFSLFSGSNKQISLEVFEFLKSQRSTSEIFSRITFLEDHSFLTQSRDEGLLSFSISPLLKAYLIEEKLIGS